MSSKTVTIFLVTLDSLGRRRKREGKQTDLQAGRLASGQRGRQADRQTNRQAGRQAGRQAETAKQRQGFGLSLFNACQ